MMDLWKRHVKIAVAPDTIQGQTPVLAQTMAQSWRIRMTPTPDYLRGLDDAIAAACCGCKEKYPFDEKQPEIHIIPGSPMYGICGSAKIRELRNRIEGTR
jgi:hypothetical protein